MLWINAPKKLIQSLLKPCSNLAQILLKPCSNLAQTSLKPCSNLAQTLLKPCSNLAQTFFKSHSNLVQISFIHWGSRGLSAGWVRGLSDEIWKIFFGKNVIHYIHYISVMVSLSADMKNAISVFYWYRPIRKLRLSGFIGIGRYEKKLIGHALGILDAQIYKG